MYVWIWHSRWIVASWSRSKYFLQSRDSIALFHSNRTLRERFSVWGKNPNDYRESHFYDLQSDWKSWENVDHESVRPTEYGPVQSCLPNRHNGAREFLTDRHKGCALQLWSTWHTLRNHSFYFNVNIAAHAVDGSKQKKLLCECVCVCCYNFCSKEIMTKVVSFKLVLFVSLMIISV